MRRSHCSTAAMKSVRSCSSMSYGCGMRSGSANKAGQAFGSFVTGCPAYPGKTARPAASISSSPHAHFPIEAVTSSGTSSSVESCSSRRTRRGSTGGEDVPRFETEHARSGDRTLRLRERPQLVDDVLNAVNTQDVSVQPENVPPSQTSLRIDERGIDLRERATEIEPLSALAPFVGCCEQLGQYRRSLRVAIAQPDPHRCGVPQLGTHAEIAHDALLPHLGDSHPNAQSRGHAGTQRFPFRDTSSLSNRSSARRGSGTQKPAADSGQHSQ